MSLLCGTCLAETIGPDRDTEEWTYCSPECLPNNPVNVANKAASKACRLTVGLRRHGYTTCLGAEASAGVSFRLDADGTPHDLRQTGGDK